MTTYTCGNCGADVDEDECCPCYGDVINGIVARVDFSDLAFVSITLEERCYFCQQFSAHVDSTGLCDTCHARFI